MPPGILVSWLPASHPSRPPQVQTGAWRGLLELHSHAMRFSPDKNRRTGSMMKRKEPRGKASNHASYTRLNLQSPAQCLTHRGHLTHICDWMIKWMNALFIYLQVSLDSLLHIRKCSMLNELELDYFQQKNISNLFKDPITDIRWNYGPPQEETRAGLEPP